MTPALSPAHAPALTVDRVSINFGGILALDGVSCSVPRGEMRGVIGPNGSGKTTLLNVVSRIYPIASGTIEIFGENVTREPSHAVARRGVARTYQRVALVAQLTVLENVMLGAGATQRDSLWHTAFRTPQYRRAEQAAVDRAMDTLRFVGIEHLENRRGDELSGGQMSTLR